MNQTATGNTFINWCGEHWLLLLAGFVILLLLVFGVCLPLYRKFRANHAKNKETAKLKDDLMAWKNLNRLARGGDSADSVRETVTVRTAMIPGLFRRGMKMLSELERKPYDLPWFMLLGEPSCGKSSLLRKCQMDTRVSVEEDKNQQEGESVPLRFWTTPQAVVLDVAGRVFFDRWMNGSGAEWAKIVKLIRKKHAKHPLDGIILTIPADALLADEESQVRKKALLIASELNRLIRSVGMLLPCWVVVTKCDMLVGFREYFDNAKDAFRNDVFGWNCEHAGTFSAADFDSFWEKVINRLCEGRLSGMLSRQVHDASGAERGAAAGDIFTFPESFNSLKPALSLYLKSLFGTENLHASEKAILSGVFFTSAEDAGVCLDAEYASALGKNVDDAPVIKQPRPERQGAFIRSLLHNFIFCRRDLAEFTAAERFRRNIPYYLASLLLLGMGISFLLSGLYMTPQISRDLKTQTGYYRFIAEKLRDGTLKKSPLIVPDGENSWELTATLPLSGDSSILRMNLFASEYDMLTTPVKPPFSFRLSSFLLFGSFTDMGYAEREIIHNGILSDMLMEPMIQIAEQELLKTPADKTVSSAEGAVIREFIRGRTLKKKPWYFFSHDRKDRDNRSIADFMRYLDPDISEASLAYFASYAEDRTTSSMTDNIFLFSKDFSRSCRYGAERLMQAWQNLNIYPESKYGQLREHLQNVLRFSELDKQLRQQIVSPANIAPEQLQANLKQRSALTEEFIRTGKQLFPMNGQNSSAVKSGILDYKDHGITILNQAVASFRDLLEQDYKALSAAASARNPARGNTSMQQEKIELWRKTVLNAINADTAVQKERMPQFYQLCMRPVGIKKTAADSIGPMTLAQLSIRLRELAAAPLHQEKSGKNGFQQNWEANEQKLKEQQSAFDWFAAICGDALGKDDSLIVSERSAMNAAMQYSRWKLLNEEAGRLPASGETLRNRIAGTRQQENVFRIPPELAGQSVGKLEYRQDFDPEAALPLMQNAAALLAKTAASPKGNTGTIQVPTRIKDIRNAFDSYLTEYIAYWRNYPDTLGFHPASYQDFQDRNATLKAYRTNAILGTVYETLRRHLAEIPAELLSPANRKLRDQTIGEFAGVMAVLTPHYTETCLRVVANWNALPKNPLEAWNVISVLPEEQFALNYSIVQGKNEAGNIGWWTHYVEDACALLRQNAVTARAKQYADCIGMIQRFPLCADASGTALSAGDLKRFLEFLPLQKTEPASAKNAGQRIHQLSPDPRFTAADRVWCERAGTIADALTNTLKPLRWSIVVLPADIQKRMCAAIAPGKTPAWLRYRYLTVAAEGAAPVNTRTEGAGKERFLLDGDAAVRRIAFSFMNYSVKGTPELTVSVEHDWAAIRLWLTPGAVYDSAAKLLYVPLYLRDSSGQESVYCIGLRFNKILPSAKEWPRRKSTPEFSRIQEQLKSGR